MSGKLTLSATQKWMQQVLVSPLNFEVDPSSHLPTQYKDDLEKIVSPNSRLSGKQRLEIYQTSYLARLRDCMEKQFMVLNHALGDELFQAFADDYLQRYPPQSYTLSNLGNRFARFLDETRPDKDLPQEERESWPDFMIELVVFEYAINKVFDAKSESQYEYATPETPDDQLALVDSLQLFQFSFPVNQYYQAAIKGEASELPMPQNSFTAIVRKKNFQIGLIDLNPSQYRFLRHWQMLGNFESARKRLLDEVRGGPNTFEQVWHDWKKYWTTSGFFKKL